MEAGEIRNEATYRLALAEVSALVELDPVTGTREGERLHVLATLVEAWEKKHYPIGLPSAIEAIKFRMEQSGMTAEDLVPYIGPLQQVSQVLDGTRPLTQPMVRRLTRLGIPAAVLVGHQVE